MCNVYAQRERLHPLTDARNLYKLGLYFLRPVADADAAAASVFQPKLRRA